MLNCPTVNVGNLLGLFGQIMTIACSKLITGVGVDSPSNSIWTRPTEDVGPLTGARGSLSVQPVAAVMFTPGSLLCAAMALYGIRFFNIQPRKPKMVPTCPSWLRVQHRGMSRAVRRSLGVTFPVDLLMPQMN